MMTTNQEKQQVSVGRSPPLVYITLRLLAQRLNGSQLSQITQLNLSGRTLPRGKIKVRDCLMHQIFAHWMLYNLLLCVCTCTCDMMRSGCDTETFQ